MKSDENYDQENKSTNSELNSRSNKDESKSSFAISNTKTSSISSKIPRMIIKKQCPKTCKRYNGKRPNTATGAVSIIPQDSIVIDSNNKDTSPKDNPQKELPNDKRGNNLPIRNPIPGLFSFDELDIIKILSHKCGAEDNDNECSFCDYSCVENKSCGGYWTNRCPARIRQESEGQPLLKGSCFRKCDLSERNLEETEKKESEENLAENILMPCTKETCDKRKRLNKGNVREMKKLAEKSAVSYQNVNQPENVILYGMQSKGIDSRDLEDIDIEAISGSIRCRCICSKRSKQLINKNDTSETETIDRHFSKDKTISKSFKKKQDHPIQFEYVCPAEENNTKSKKQYPTIRNKRNTRTSSQFEETDTKFKENKKFDLNNIEHTRKRWSTTQSSGKIYCNASESFLDCSAPCRTGVYAECKRNDNIKLSESRLTKPTTRGKSVSSSIQIGSTESKKEKKIDSINRKIESTIFSKKTSHFDSQNKKPSHRMEEMSSELINQIVYSSKELSQQSRKNIEETLSVKFNESKTINIQGIVSRSTTLGRISLISQTSEKRDTEHRRSSKDNRFPVSAKERTKSSKEREDTERILDDNNRETHKKRKSPPQNQNKVEPIETFLKTYYGSQFSSIKLPKQPEVIRKKCFGLCSKSIRQKLEHEKNMEVCKCKDCVCYHCSDPKCKRQRRQRKSLPPDPSMSFKLKQKSCRGTCYKNTPITTTNFENQPSCTCHYAADSSILECNTDSIYENTFGAIEPAPLIYETDLTDICLGDCAKERQEKELIDKRNIKKRIVCPCYNPKDGESLGIVLDAICACTAVNKREHPKHDKENDSKPNEEVRNKNRKDSNGKKENIQREEGFFDGGARRRTNNNNTLSHLYEIQKSRDYKDEEDDKIYNNDGKQQDVRINEIKATGKQPTIKVKKIEKKIKHNRVDKVINIQTKENVNGKDTVGVELTEIIENVQKAKNNDIENSENVKTEETATKTHDDTFPNLPLIRILEVSSDTIIRNDLSRVFLDKLKDFVSNVCFIDGDKIIIKKVQKQEILEGKAVKIQNIKEYVKTRDKLNSIEEVIKVHNVVGISEMPNNMAIKDDQNDLGNFSFNACCIDGDRMIIKNLQKEEKAESEEKNMRNINKEVERRHGCKPLTEKIETFQKVLSFTEKSKNLGIRDHLDGENVDKIKNFIFNVCYVEGDKIILRNLQKDETPLTKVDDRENINKQVIPDQTKLTEETIEKVGNLELENKLDNSYHILNCLKEEMNYFDHKLTENFEININDSNCVTECLRFDQFDQKLSFGQKCSEAIGLKSESDVNLTEKLDKLTTEVKEELRQDIDMKINSVEVINETNAQTSGKISNGFVNMREREKTQIMEALKTTGSKSKVSLKLQNDSISEVTSQIIKSKRRDGCALQVNEIGSKTLNSKLIWNVNSSLKKKESKYIYSRLIETENIHEEVNISNRRKRLDETKELKTLYQMPNVQSECDSKAECVQLSLSSIPASRIVRQDLPPLSEIKIVSTKDKCENCDFHPSCSTKPRRFVDNCNGCDNCTCTENDLAIHPCSKFGFYFGLSSVQIQTDSEQPKASTKSTLKSL